MSRTPTTIDFEHLGIGSVLKRYRLRVPPNQRDYSWTEREVQTIFQDFSRAMTSDDRTHFLGSIVTIPRDPGVLEVVDGQQRLATTAILLSAIRDTLREKESVIADSIEHEFLTQTDRAARERVSKLRLNVDDNSYFGSLLAGRAAEPTRQSHKLLASAFERARQHVAAVVRPHDPNGWGDVLNRWIEFIEHDALVILLKVPSDANAYRMFETLNDRGLRTSQADLVKNYLFGQAGDRLAEVQAKWLSMRGALESLEEHDITITFLRQALIAMGGHLRQEDVYERVQTTVRSSHNAATFASDLDDLAGDYVAMFNPANEKWNQYNLNVRRAIEALNLFDVRPLRPLMLAVSRRFVARETELAFNMFISWCVRLLIAGSTRTGSVEIALSSAAKDVYSNTIATADTLANAVRHTIPADAEFREACAVSNVSKPSLARYYLRALEQVANEEDEPWFIPNDDQTVITLEHVLPRKMEGNWPEVDDDTHRLYYKRLGNLALLQFTPNSNLKSAGFTDKAEAYANAPYVLTRQIAEAPSWGPGEIERRQQELAELAVQAWPI